MFDEIMKYAVKPQLYTPGTSSLWDDEHISKGMLEAHLNPHWDAASRKHEFIDESVNWISNIVPPTQYELLLDLGCGPGLYAERFNCAGYSVVGIDFSKRSIEYAKEIALRNSSAIMYHYQNYLTIDYDRQFDVVTLIYCDYSVMSITDRLFLLKKILNALKTGGKLIFDVFTPRMRKPEGHIWQCLSDGGFFSEKPHILLESIYQYDDDDRTHLQQSIVLTEDSVCCYNIWDHFFTAKSLMAEIQTVGFSSVELFGDVAGKEFSENGETICAVLTK